jgi:hypothetical protein
LRPKVLTERKKMITPEDAFSIFRKWEEESSLIEFLPEPVVDAPPLRPPRGLLRVVDVLEPDEIVVRTEGKTGGPVPVDLRNALFEYADTRETSAPTSRVWVCFIQVILPSGQTWLFAERDLS